MTMEEGFLRIDNDEIAGQCKNLSNRNSHADSILKVNYSLWKYFNSDACDFKSLLSIFKGAIVGLINQ